MALGRSPIKALHTVTSQAPGQVFCLDSNSDEPMEAKNKRHDEGDPVHIIDSLSLDRQNLFLLAVQPACVRPEKVS